MFRIAVSFLLFLFIYGCNSSKKAIATMTIEEIKAYQLNNGRTMISLLIESNWTPYPPTVTLIKIGSNWKVLKYQERHMALKPDFITQYKCDSGKAIFDKILALGALTLPSEQELKTPCILLIDTIINGKAVVGIRDPSGDSDRGYCRLKISFKDSAREIGYYDPYSAVEVCPSSKERMAFLEIYKIMNAL